MTTGHHSSPTGENIGCIPIIIIIISSSRSSHSSSSSSSSSSSTGTLHFWGDHKPDSGTVI